jgi:hypothetical protein
MCLPPFFQRNHSIPQISPADLALTWLILMVSGNPSIPLMLDGWELILVCTFLLVAMVGIMRKRMKIPPESLIPFMGFIFLFACQAHSFHTFPWTTWAGFFLRLLIGLGSVVVVRNPVRHLIVVLSFLSLVSLLFWGVGLAGRSGPYASFIRSLAESFNTLGSGKAYLLVHGYLFESPEVIGLRNMGMFWEPGAFSGYLSLALILLGLTADHFSRRDYRLCLTLLSLGILSTLSTTGYVSLPLVWVLHLLCRRADFPPPAYLLVLIFILSAASVLVCKLDFVGEKIMHHYEEGIYQTNPNWYLTRFGSMVFDWEYIARRPLTGWGIANETRFALHQNMRTLKFGMGNGLTDFIARFGGLGLLLYMLMTVQSLHRLNPQKHLAVGLAIAIILVSLCGETFLNYPLFLSLMFLQPNKPVNKLQSLVVVQRRKPLI